MANEKVKIEDFSIVGVNHWDATVDIRERFSLKTEQMKELIQGGQRGGIESLFVISTCNRTEVFAQNTAPKELIRLLTTYSDARMDDFRHYGFKKEGKPAVNHIFEVVTGLDSQILGDLQVVNQVKESYRLASDMKAISGEMHQLMQHIFRAHKRSRNETALAEGTSSTAYAAVKFAQETFGNLEGKGVLLVGTGQIGKVTCKNLVSLGATELTLINRTRERAKLVANKFDAEVAKMAQLPEELAKADLIVVATGADKPVVNLDDMKPSILEPKYKVMVDLAVPRNIVPEIGELDFVDLANMDLLTDVTDKAYRRREENIPKVKAIIDDERSKYEDWLSKQVVVPTIKALTSKLDDIRKDEYDFFENKIAERDQKKVEKLTRRIVNKIAAYSIEHLRSHHESEQVTQVVNDMFKLENQSIYE